VSVLNKRLPTVVGRRPRIGLLGGSFNPAHKGHLHISRLALKHLDLDAVWWLVSPQNPLKSTEGMAPMEERLARAVALAKDRKIWVTDIESTLGTHYTIDTLAALKGHFPQARFVWIIGADNLIQMSHWKNWTAIFEAVVVAVFARPDYSSKALTSTAAKRFARRRINQLQAAGLIELTPPAWSFLCIPLSAASATKIRNGTSDDWQRATRNKEFNHTKK
jgi:nicotinate-nucleotide adenylyltransferase